MTPEQITNALINIWCKIFNITTDQLLGLSEEEIHSKIDHAKHVLERNSDSGLSKNQVLFLHESENILIEYCRLSRSINFEQSLSKLAQKPGRNSDSLRRLLQTTVEVGRHMRESPEFTRNIQKAPIRFTAGQCPSPQPITISFSLKAKLMAPKDQINAATADSLESNLTARNPQPIFNDTPIVMPNSLCSTPRNSGGEAYFTSRSFLASSE